MTPIHPSVTYIAQLDAQMLAREEPERCHPSGAGVGTRRGKIIYKLDFLKLISSLR